ncbi:HdeD family acid-resistance protein [Xylophilus sp.]|uniref:HdeD family acid-resistance protein n=1 Tax=Xylophilus sp. TaxID=2653893 RepID=UPI0013BE31CD|nr:HdeD family acid-resistance protein [Xylophilus sp.]KAF1048943.1 MAG: hypothetical protein GAK38_01058 [Xylophilus sp.]
MANDLPGAGAAPSAPASSASVSSGGLLPPGALGRHWGWIALRGVAALVFGVLAFVLPGLTLAVLVTVWGVYALIDGVLALVAGLRIRDAGRPLWSLVVVGLLGIAAGVVALLWPGITALTLVLIIGVWSVAIGVFQIVAAVHLRKEIAGEWLHALSGLLSIVFGAFVLVAPGAGALALVWVIAGYAVVFGVLLLGLALRLRRQQRA